MSLCLLSSRFGLGVVNKELTVQRREAYAPNEETATLSEGEAGMASEAETTTANLDIDFTEWPYRWVGVGVANICYRWVGVFQGVASICNTV